MFGTLFLKECRQVLRSLVYYMYVVIFVLFITSQMSSEGSTKLREPMPGEADYGETITHDETLIMEGTLKNLVEELNYNSFATYPMGFYKAVKLSESEAARATEILERCTGKTFEALRQEMADYYNQFSPEFSPKAAEAARDYKVSAKEGLTYGEFQEAMEEVCRLVGRGSSYEKEHYENRIRVPMTYEQAKEEYDNLCTEDRITRAFMRLFCDYAGIVLAILPIFVGVSRALRDRRAKAEQVLFSKSASGTVIIVSRYLANLVMLCLPVLASAFLLQQPYYYRAQTLGVQGDIWAFLTVPGVWLIPEIMIVLALSFLITECTGTILAVFVQVAWGIGGLFAATTLIGDFGLRLVARWNTLGESTLYASQESALLLNRGYYCLLSALCVVLTAIVYERKRKTASAGAWVPGDRYGTINSPAKK